MAAMNPNKLSQLPEEMLTFTLLNAAQRAGARLGRLAARGRSPTQTPHYVGNTSRGVVPHLSQDNLAKHTSINALYLGLEDFIEKVAPRTPPIFEIQPENGKSSIHAFTGHNSETLLIMGPRRVPPVEAPLSNSNSQLAICTSVGFRYLEVEDYIDAACKLQSDIVIAPGDIVTGQKPSMKRMEKMCDRTAVWLRDTIHFVGKHNAENNGSRLALFAPILPVAPELQTWYTEQLIDDFRSGISGLYFHDPYSVLDLDDSLVPLPRLAFTTPASPSELLHEISLGIDLFVLPLVGAATDAGTALDFSFPPPASDGQTLLSRRPLGIDAWDSSFATDVSPLRPGCTCYACQKHHRAYLHHLLSAKEMLAWVLLQIHNYQIMDEFFAGVRKSIANGTFDQNKAAFEMFYEPQLPVTAGHGPRVRGYQTKSKGGGEPKKNPKAYNKLDDMAENLAEAAVPSPDVDAGDLEEHGLGRVQTGAQII